MSSASGDEAELALAEPGKKGIPSNCRSVRSIARPLPRQSFVRGSYAKTCARHDCPAHETAISKWRLVCIERYKYTSFTFSVRRTRSGRARKTAVVAKKSPVKKLLARATRSPRKIHEIEEPEV